MDNKDNREFRHRLIQEEFRSILTSGEYKLPEETDGIVVLSAAPLKDGEKIIDEKSPDNVARIKRGIEVIRMIAARKSGRKLKEITIEDILKFSPPLVLNGETEQLRMMRNVAEELGFPEDKIVIVDCGERGEGNTKTQFESIDRDPRFKDYKHLTFITHDWHAPRVVRTGDANLRSSLHFDVIPVSEQKDSPCDIFKVVRGEVRRIEKYSQKGDISRDLGHQSL